MYLAIYLEYHLDKINWLLSKNCSVDVYMGIYIYIIYYILYIIYIIYNIYIYIYIYIYIVIPIPQRYRGTNNDLMNKIMYYNIGVVVRVFNVFKGKAKAHKQI